jgi:hypothetical protein
MSHLAHQGDKVVIPGYSIGLPPQSKPVNPYGNNVETTKITKTQVPLHYIIYTPVL